MTMPIERLITSRDALPLDMPRRERQQLEYTLNKLAAELLRDAMMLKLCSASDALGAVYLSGLWHGAMLGARAFEKADFKP